MRRSIALFMILVFGSFVSAPLIAASSDPLSQLPTCCRVNGKHHCMMRIMQGDPGGIQISGPRKCPLFPKWRPMNALHNEATPTSVSVLFYAGLQSHPACHAQAEAQKRISFDRSRQKRGPPAVLVN
jgi:hypothetical protein